MSYDVAQRMQEIGIRIALGANRRGVRNVIVIRALKMSLAGGVVGLLASLWLNALLRSQLFGVTPSDPVSFAVVIAMLFIVTLAAAYLPASRASRMDPIVALHHE